MHDATDPGTVDTAIPLSSALKQATRELHRRAERTGVVCEIVHGRVSRAQYLLYLRNLHTVYQALEQALAPLASDPEYRHLSHRGLARTGCIERDLDFLHGPEWRSRLASLPCANEYAGRIGGASPAQLVAHAYVRYLGDLNGGQIVKRLLQKHLGLDAAGLGFYEFDEIDDLADFQQGFRDTLDGLAARHDRMAVIDEAKRAFRESTRLSIGVLETNPG